MAKLNEISGIGVPFEVKLAQSGIHSVETLLQQGSIPHGRKAISVKTGVSEQQVLEWVCRADLRRIANLSTNHLKMVEAAGIHSLAQLAQSCPDELFRKITEFNNSENLTAEPPTQSEVEEWVVQARSIQQVVIY